MNGESLEVEPLSKFEAALANLPEGYCEGYFEGHLWGVTVKRSNDGKRMWLYAEEFGGTDVVSFNLYSLSRTGPVLKPCEMSSSKVIDFILNFELMQGNLVPSA